MSEITLTLGAVGVLALFWAMHRSRHPFDVRDMLMDPATGKASLNAGIIFLMAALAVWTVVDRERAGKDDVSTILLGVLGVFVTGRVVAQGIATFKPGPDMNTTVERTTRETVTVDPIEPRN